MTPADMKAAREKCGLDPIPWALALGYRGSRQVLSNRTYGMENGIKTITPQVARLAEMFRRYGVPRGWEKP